MDNREAEKILRDMKLSDGEIKRIGRALVRARFDAVYPTSLDFNVKRKGKPK